MAPEQMACRKPIDEDRGASGNGVGEMVLQLKGRLVLLFSPKSSLIILWFKSELIANVCVLEVCVVRWHAFEAFTPAA